MDRVGDALYNQNHFCTILLVTSLILASKTYEVFLC